MIGGAAQVSATSGAAEAGKTAPTQSSDYFVDMLFRSEHPSDAAGRDEVGRILAHGLKQDDVPAADKTYLAKLLIGLLR